MRSSRKFKWLIGVGSLFVLTAALAFWPFCFFHDSVCSQCGALQHVTEWQLPHSRYSFFRRFSVEPTVLSDYLLSSGVVSAHEHQWLFGHGGGNGVRCALGDGDRIRATVGSADVARLLSMTRQFGEQQQSRELLRFAFDRDMSRSIRFLAANVPTNGFASAEEYRVWIADNRWLVDDALEIEQQSR
jgi:hypothetical protein